MSCNGWTNRETWLVNLRFGDTLNAEQQDGVEITPEYVEQLVLDHLEGNVIGGFAEDIISGALAMVDWREIARWYRGDEG